MWALASSTTSSHSGRIAVNSCAEAAAVVRIVREHAIAALDEGIEAGEPDRAVEARASVQRDERPPLPPRGRRNSMSPTETRIRMPASRAPETITRTIATATGEAVDDEDRVVVPAHVAEQPRSRSGRCPPPRACRRRTGPPSRRQLPADTSVHPLRSTAPRTTGTSSRKESRAAASRSKRRARPA